MPFKKMDIFNSEQSYKAELKKELKKLDATPGDFYFYDEVTLNGAAQSILIVGEAAPPLLKELKSKAKQRAVGQCSVKDGTLRLSLVKGRMPEKKLKPLMKGTQFGYELVAVDLDAGGEADPDKRFLKRLQAVESRFDKIKGRITDDERKELRILFGQIEEQKDTDQAQAAKTLIALNTRMEELIKLIGGGKEASKEETNAKTRLKATTARFDKVKGKIMDDERKALRQHFGAVAEHFEKGEWKQAYARLEVLDKEMVGYVKAALASDEQDAEKRSEEFAQSDSGKAAKMLASRIKEEIAKLGKLETAVTREAGVLKDLQETLSGLTKAKDISKKQQQVDASAERLEKAKQVLEQSRGQLLKNVEEMKAEKLEKEKAFVTALGNIKSRITALDEMLDSVPVDQARSQIEALIKKQAEAQQWQEERIKAEDGGEGHGTGRHGAQTGMERQAMRASSQDGVTPDQSGNSSGTAQVTEKWNKVKITYTEEDGKRVIANRSEVEKQIAASFDRKQYSGGNASMWATPVLEKEAFDRATTIAAKFKGFTHYATGKKTQANQVTDELTSLTLKMGPPASAPGWGYALKRDGAAVSLNDIKSAVSDFEQGKSSLDEMFKALNVKLVEKSGGGGVKMVPHCLVVLTRSSTAGDWKFKTHFPDDRLGSSDIGWETERNQSKGDVTFKQGTTLTVWKNNKMPN
ncbi:hypothetical protein [Leisingera sp. ANG-S5]|uniref:hypothetical protein n=1 Tax=Leisingera sp. ANG-S5 TaxID=1577901 RepID=UPI00057F5B9C|nr:hypothetical protein [Leisingera sp. ANG-S5]KIC32598.1 hypothetical protein RA25_08680 [Leisingera sp. ANG-S5]